MASRSRTHAALTSVLAALLVTGSALLAAPAAHAEPAAQPDGTLGAEPQQAPAEQQAAPDQAPADQAAAEQKPDPDAVQAGSDTAVADAAGDSPVADATPDAVPEEEAGAEARDAAPLPADQGVTVEPLEFLIAPQESLTVTVVASGFDASVDSIEAALIPRGTEGEVRPDSGFVARAEPASVLDGKVELALTADAARLERGTEYEVLLWKRDEFPPAAGSIYARAEAALDAAQWDALLGAAPVDPAWNENAAVGSFEWGVRASFRKYVEGPIAKGKITVVKPATGTDVYRFPQTSNAWDPESRTGTASYAGRVNFKGHGGVLDLDFANPTVEVVSASRAALLVPYEGKALTIATIDLQAPADQSGPAAKTRKLSDGSIRFEHAKVKLTEAGSKTYFEEYVGVDYELDRLSFTVGADSKTDKPVVPPKKPEPGSKPKPKPETPKPLPATDGTGASGVQAAGSLNWGISSAFANYVTGPIAKGSISTNGVGSSGGGYLFPQAAGGSWNAQTHTGTVQYSGVVTYTGHRGLLSESFANPVITVSSETTGTISAGGRSFTLDLASASKSVGANGEVSWSGVPVLGGISGGASGGSQYTLAVDPLSFTVGAVSQLSYGSTEAGVTAKVKRTPAAAPPATSGIRVLTDAEKLTAGGRIEIEAGGFEPGDEGVLVVLYSDPIVLDENATADANGTVRWSGTLPKDVTGTHTITLQGSTDAGAVIEIRETDDAKRTKLGDTVELAALEDGAIAEAGVVPAVTGRGGLALWEWWASALGLVAIAACTTTLAIRQRRAQQPVRL
ncbi:HtaA domain-containing protein [Leucobacter massiliensis]|nr:HtaA domain-containing protein [Leucobacter massiliensis]